MKTVKVAKYRCKYIWINIAWLDASRIEIAWLDAWRCTFWCINETCRKQFTWYYQKRVRRQTVIYVLWWCLKMHFLIMEMCRRQFTWYARKELEGRLWYMYCDVNQGFWNCSEPYQPRTGTVRLWKTVHNPRSSKSSHARLVRVSFDRYSPVQV